MQSFLQRHAGNVIGSLSGFGRVLFRGTQRMLASVCGLGRAPLRCVLYMATIAAIRCNPVIKAFSARLARAGKVPKVRIVACVRKLLTLLNAMARDGVTWDQLNSVKNFASNP